MSIKRPPRKSYPEDMMPPSLEYQVCDIIIRSGIDWDKLSKPELVIIIKLITKKKCFICNTRLVFYEICKTCRCLCCVL